MVGSAIRRRRTIGRLTVRRTIGRLESGHHIVGVGLLELVLGDPVLHAVHGLGVGEAIRRAVDLVEELAGVDEAETIHETTKRLK